jgi:hypothetical protein
MKGYSAIPPCVLACVIEKSLSRLVGRGAMEGGLQGDDGRKDNSEQITVNNENNV